MILGGTNNSHYKNLLLSTCLNIPWLREGGKKVRKLIWFHNLKNTLKKMIDKHSLSIQSHKPD